MKKLFFLTALLCASLMGFAVDQDTWIPVNADGAAYANQFKWYEIDGIAKPNNVVEIQKPGFTTEVGIYLNFTDAAFDAVYFNDVLATDGTEYKQDGAGMVIHISALTMKNTNIVLKQGTTVRFGLRVYNDKGTSSGTEKEDPALSLNETAVTLSAESPAETFQIIPTQSGDGAITYVSDKPGIASVDADGLVTAVGRGTANISVKTAETETYAAAIKKLTVTVNGPINWDGLDWLAGSSDKYKLVVTPDIADNFGGKHVQGSDLWIGFPSAAFGEMSIEPSDGAGAWKTFALSNFPNKVNQFTVVCDGTTYTFDVYFVDGAEIPTAISHVADGAKAIKIIENGQVVIVRNGVKYNVAGQEIK